jgi:hypothetical protein
VKQEAYTSFLQEYEKDAQGKRKDLERELRNDISMLVSTLPGQRFLWWLLSITGVFLPSYTGNSDTYFNEGRRAVGLEVMHRLATVAPQRFLEMINTGETKDE